MPIARFPNDYLNERSKTELIELIHTLYDAYDDLEIDCDKSCEYLRGLIPSSQEE